MKNIILFQNTSDSDELQYCISNAYDIGEWLKSLIEQIPRSCSTTTTTSVLADRVKSATELPTPPISKEQVKKKRRRNKDDKDDDGDVEYRLYNCNFNPVDYKNSDWSSFLFDYKSQTKMNLCDKLERLDKKIGGGKGRRSSPSNSAINREDDDDEEYHVVLLTTSKQTDWLSNILFYLRLKHRLFVYLVQLYDYSKSTPFMPHVNFVANFNNKTKTWLKMPELRPREEIDKKKNTIGIVHVCGPR